MYKPNDTCRTCYKRCKVSTKEYTYLGCLCAKHLPGTDPQELQEQEEFLSKKQAKRLQMVIDDHDKVLIKDRKRASWLIRLFNFLRGQSKN